MYFYKLTLRNGMNYFVKDKERHICRFMESIAKNNNWRDFLLAYEYYCRFEKEGRGTTFNTIMLLTSEIIAVEYATEIYA